MIRAASRLDDFDRAFARPDMMALESAMDELAEKLGLAPIEFRFRAAQTGEGTKKSLVFEFSTSIRNTQVLGGYRPLAQGFDSLAIYGSAAAKRHHEQSGEMAFRIRRTAPRLAREGTRFRGLTWAWPGSLDRGSRFAAEFRGIGNDERGPLK